MTGFASFAERLMGMDDRAWARHANPLSCYSRFTILPLLALAIWSRAWLGAWALVPVALVLLWAWVDPRLFAPPARLDSWAARGVLGERVYLARRAEVPRHHRRWAAGLSIATLPGLVVLGVGLWGFRADWVLFGLALGMGPKIWFVDRMAWLYADWLADTGKELGDV